MISECAKCGQPLLDQYAEYCPGCQERNPNTSVGTFGFVPLWAWVFIVACGAIPVVTMGGAVPFALGGGAAVGCATVAKKPRWSAATRVGACVGITLGAWVAFVAFLLAWNAWR